MYNLIITSIDGEWDENEHVMPGSRFLEYTSDEVKHRFNNLDKREIEQLISLPCLFLYERNASDGYVGYINELKIDGRDFHFKKNKLTRISKDILDEPSIQSKLGISGFEMYRTHWAVKSEDISGIFDDDELIREFHPQGGYVFISRNTQDKLSESTPVSSLREFIDQVISMENENGVEIFFRGQASEKYDFEPSISRKNADGKYKYIEDESDLFTGLLVDYPNDFINDRSTLDRLVRMQHYSLPTRLLDITSNPLVALYFACESLSDESNREKTGVVAVFSVKKSSVKYFDSDTVCCLSNLARLSYTDKTRIESYVSEYKLTPEELDVYNKRLPGDYEGKIRDFNKKNEVSRLLHFIREDRSYYKDVIVPNHLSDMYVVKSKKNNQRIVAQSGAFIIFGAERVVNKLGAKDIDVKLIKVKNKDNIIKELDKININERTLFPDIESAAKYLKRICESEV
ncbi:FRG domain-containing protein [Aeromonas dhakensis]|uniref:FRG domain-containing protein n=1 Tax=Aeromonas dhakensis TaxID=196024 RepID=UPI0023660470|nr:FRG domain-containing protein [Aeromonas dhakensis]WDF94083.1 FRG domain-containing protein [Aeromonas dhakensis]